MGDGTVLVTRRQVLRAGLTVAALGPLAALAACGGATPQTTPTAAPIGVPALPARVATRVGSPTTGGGAANAQRVTFYTILPRTGANQAQSASIVAAVQMALDDVGHRAGPFTIVYGPAQDLDDGSPLHTGNWDADVDANNALRIADDRDAAICIGTYNSGAAKDVIRILNGAGIGMISPANTYAGLTRPFAAGEPGMYYPWDERNFCRVCIHDDVQGVVGAAYADEIGARQVYVIDDGELYGRGLARVFVEEATRRHLAVVSPNAASRTLDPRATTYRPLADEIRASGATLVYYGGTSSSNAGLLWRDLRDVLGPQVRIMGPDGIRNSDWLDAAGPAAQGTLVTFGGVPPEELTGAGAAWYQAYRTRYGEPEGYAAYAYEATRVAVAAVARAGTKDRAAIRRALLGTQRYEGILGTWSFDANGDKDTTTLTVNEVRDGRFVSIKRIG